MRTFVLLALFALIPNAMHAATVGETYRFLPLIQDGDGWKTLVSVVNLGTENARVSVTFLNSKAMREVWDLKLRSAEGQVYSNTVEGTIPPGAALTMETDGSPSELRRGYAYVTVLSGKEVGASAVLTRTAEGKVTQVMTVPFSPEHEKRSIVPLTIGKDADVECVWVSGTTSAMLDVTFRDTAGKVIAAGSVQFNQDAQLFVRPKEMWPELAEFKGTMEWVASFPSADYYEDLVMSGLVLSKHGDAAASPVSGMTLPAHQAKSAQY